MRQRFMAGALEILMSAYAAAFAPANGTRELPTSATKS